MHALRLLGLGIVLGLMLVGIAAWQDPQYRGGLMNPGIRPAVPDQLKRARAKQWINHRPPWKISNVLRLFKG